MSPPHLEEVPCGQHFVPCISLGVPVPCRGGCTQGLPGSWSRWGGPLVATQSCQLASSPSCRTARGGSGVPAAGATFELLKELSTGPQ